VHDHESNAHADPDADTHADAYPNFGQHDVGLDVH
jgi:hypothetical protein